VEIPAHVRTVFLCDASTVSRPVMAYMTRTAADPQAWNVFQCGEPAEVLQTTEDGTDGFTTDEALDKAFSLAWPDAVEVSLTGNPSSIREG